MYTKYCCAPQNTNKQMLLLICYLGFCHYKYAYHTYRIGNNKWTVFRKKLHTKRTTCIQLYNTSGQLPDYIFSSYVQTTEHDWNSLFLAAFKISHHEDQNLSWAQGETERSTSSFSDEEGDIGMSSSSSSEHLADDKEEHLQL